MRREGTTTLTTTAAPSTPKLPAHTRDLQLTPPPLLRHLAGEITVLTGTTGSGVSQEIGECSDLNSSDWCDY